MADAPNIEALLAKLEQFVSENPNKSFFGGPASSEDIYAVKSATGCELPESYQRFLRLFNGGFIALDCDANDEDWDLEDAAWNSNLLLGTEQIMERWAQSKEMYSEIGWEGDWKYLPFCHTDGQETLVFSSPDDATKESLVLDAFHECPPDGWDELYPTFAHLLDEYVANAGEIRTIAGEDDEDEGYRCPTSGCFGRVTWMEEEGESSHWFCDMCGSIWIESRNLFKEIDEIIERFSYRRVCYVKIDDQWQPADVDLEPTNYEDLVEDEPEDTSEDPMRG